MIIVVQVIIYVNLLLRSSNLVFTSDLRNIKPKPIIIEPLYTLSLIKSNLRGEDFTNKLASNIYSLESPNEALQPS